MLICKELFYCEKMSEDKIKLKQGSNVFNALTKDEKVFFAVEIE